MSDISNQLIKDSYNYVLQSDLGTGIIYRIGGLIPVNPIFQSGLTVTGGFTYSGAGEQVGYALLTDGTGYAYWGPISAATPSSGVTSITVGNGLSANSSTGAVTIIFTGSTGLSGEYLPLSGGTVTGDTTFTSGVSVNTLTANTSNFDNLYVSNFTEVHYLDVFDVSNFYSTANFFQDITVSGTVYSDTISATTYLNYPDSYVTGFTSNGNQLTITQNRSDTYSALTLTLTGITATTTVAQGITGITGTSGVSASTTNYNTTIINTAPDKTVVITGGTGIQIISDYPNFGVNLTGTTGLTYYVSAATPSGVSLISGDRWFNTSTGIELVWINDGDSTQWIQPFSVPGPVSPDVGYHTVTGITSGQTLTWDKTYWGISAQTNVNLTLPTTTGKDGYYIIIKDEGGYCGTYRIRLTPASGLIDGNNYVDMSINYMSLTCMVRGGNWYLI